MYKIFLVILLFMFAVISLNTATDRAGPVNSVGIEKCINTMTQDSNQIDYVNYPNPYNVGQEYSLLDASGISLTQIPAPAISSVVFQSKGINNETEDIIAYNALTPRFVIAQANNYKKKIETVRMISKNTASRAPEVILRT